MKTNSLFSNIRRDLPASIVVFLVALPLCLGIALASGAPLIAGLIAGVVGGVVVGLASGSQLGVSGPAAGLAALVLVAIDDLGSFELFLTAVIVAGIFQIILGFMRAGVIGYYFPNSVIKGMLTGIGLIIIIKQIPHIFGWDSDPIGDMNFVQVDGHNTFSELYHMLNGISLGAVLVSGICLGLMILWERPFIKQHKYLAYIPGPLLAVGSGILLTQLFQGIPALAIGAGHYVDIPSISGLESLPRPDLSSLGDPKMWTVAFTIAIVASLETLLSAEASDKLDPEKRVTPTNRELKAQGLGNIISGMLGGLPITQVIVRSSANIQAGGHGPLSTVLHGLLLLISVLLLPTLLRLIPLACLAAILLLVGYKLANPKLFLAQWKAGKNQFALFVVTVLGVAFMDLLTGVALGLGIAVIQILWKNYTTPYLHEPNRYKSNMPIYIELSEHVTFLNKASIKRTLDELPEGSRVVIDGTRSIDLDSDVREIIDTFSKNAHLRNIRLQVLNMDPSNYLKRPSSNSIFASPTI